MYKIYGLGKIKTGNRPKLGMITCFCVSIE